MGQISDEEYSRAVQDFAESARAAHLDAFAIGGTLLAAVRDKKPIPWDKDDLDFALIWNGNNYPNYAKFHQEMNERGWINARTESKGFKKEDFANGVIRHHWQFSRWVGENCDTLQHIDVFIFYKIVNVFGDEYYIKGTIVGDGKSDKYWLDYMVLPEHYLHAFKPVQYCGQIIYIPVNAEHLLAWDYGKNWRIPKNQGNAMQERFVEMRRKRFKDFMEGAYFEELYEEEEQ